MPTTPEDDFIAIGDEILQLQDRLVECKRAAAEIENQIRMLAGARTYIQRKKQLEQMETAMQKPEEKKEELLPFSRVSAVPSIIRNRPTKENN